MLGRGRWRTCAMALLATLAWREAAVAQDAPRYSLQGFGGWAYGQTDNDNFFGYSASPEGVWDNYYFALNFWVSPEFVLKLNGYSVDGNMIARPASSGLAVVLGTIEETTGVLLLGAQFSF